MQAVTSIWAFVIMGAVVDAAAMVRSFKEKKIFFLGLLIMSLILFMLDLIMLC